jgi:uncharacterized protein (TIGR02444 family)
MALPPTSVQASLWSFSLAVYAQARVPVTLIHWQDTLDADINMVLWCCWVGGFHNCRLDSRLLADVDAEIAAWRANIVQPLRAIRTHIKQDLASHLMPGAQAAREAVLAAELVAEQVVQACLQTFSEKQFALVDGAEFGQAEAARALQEYFSYLGVDADLDISVLLQACEHARGRLRK